MELIDNISKTLRDDLATEINKGSKVSIAAACFSIYAFQELKNQLKDIDELRFIFTSPAFITEKAKKEKREFYIPRLNRERSLYGTEFEVKLRNELSQKAIELPVATEPATSNIPDKEPTITEPATPNVPEEPPVTAPTVPEVPIPDPPKEVHTHSYTITATPPTCTQQGVTHYTCTCGYSYDEIFFPLEHEWGRWHVIKEATTEEDGEEGMFCKRCNAKISNPLEKLPILATGEDWEEVADLLIQYINAIRAAEGVAPAIKMSDGCAAYAKLRSEQMAAKGKAEHNVSDGRAAATQLQYGYYVDPGIYGIPGEPYFYVNGGEAVAKDLVLTIDGSAQRLANGFHSSSPHWSYIGTEPYISVGLTMRGGYWYCCIIMAEVDLDENPNGF